MAPATRAECLAADAADPLAHVRARFHLDGARIYLDGNSLGPPAAGVQDALERVARDEWRGGLIGSWNQAGWLDQPFRLGDRIGTLVGAAPGQVAVTDSTSVNLFKLLAAALAWGRDSGRRRIATTRDNFPTDLYIAEGVAELGGGQVAEHLDATTAVLTLSHVDYRTGRMLDMPGRTQEAHAAGALVCWDLSHSAGAVPVELDAWDVDMAVGCTYKFLNCGPGAPAFLYVAERWQPLLANAVRGWFGHAEPFAFSPEFRPAAGIARFLSGTPGIIGLAGVAAALDAWEGVSINDVRKKSVAIAEMLMGRLDRLGLEVASPRSAAERGSQVSVRHPEGYGLSRALGERGVVTDFRPPDILRFGITPLYLRYADAWDAMDALESVLAAASHQDVRWRERARVP
ncbi:MAG: aminotransferase class V-fold PLP-dependent enzyme [Chloroflexi bacterium]|nr:MAG: aminotransferase class V-fold PLP-dependent enzyme [Chloroflexota bacterium]